MRNSGNRLRDRGPAGAVGGDGTGEYFRIVDAARPSRRRPTRLQDGEPIAQQSNPIGGRQRLKPAAQRRQPCQELVIGGGGQPFLQPVQPIGVGDTSGNSGTIRPCNRERR